MIGANFWLEYHYCGGKTLAGNYKPKSKENEKRYRIGLPTECQLY